MPILFNFWTSSSKVCNSAHTTATDYLRALLLLVIYEPSCCWWQVYAAEATPVEEFYRGSGNLIDFEITGGIPETLPRLLDVVAEHSGVPAAKLKASTS